jgi:DNA gyrase subunit A
MLVNGAGGIAVGMATNIPPHNLGEVIDATLALIERPRPLLGAADRVRPAPISPPAADPRPVRRAQGLSEGRGSVIIRAKTRVEEIRKDRYAIVIDEIPYQVNKATMIEKIADLVREKKIEGIGRAGRKRPRRRARGDRAQARRDARGGAEPALPLHADADLFGCNMLALNGGRPEQLTLRGFLTAFIDFREEVVARRTAFELRKARERRMCCAASPWRCPTWTRSWPPSAPPPMPPRRAKS